MESGKKRAERALTKRINDFKPEGESIGQMIHEVVDEIWNIFEVEQDEVLDAVLAKRGRINAEKQRIS